MVECRVWRKREMKIITYSERGIVDSLVYSLNDDLTKELLVISKIEDVKNRLTDFCFYLEPSLSEFGDPDLLISYKRNDEPVVVFTEAKVSNNSKYWTLKRQYDNYRASKNIGSNFFRQIGLKHLLIEKRSVNINDLSKKGVSTLETRIMGRSKSKKIGTNKIVRKLYVSVIRTAKHFEYLGLLPEANTKNFSYVEDDKKIFSKLNFLTWKQIEDFADKHNLIELKNNFNWNLGIIYE